MEIDSQNTTSQHILRERKKREGTPSRDVSGRMEERRSSGWANQN